MSENEQYLPKVYQMNNMKNSHSNRLQQRCPSKWVCFQPPDTHVGAFNTGIIPESLGHFWASPEPILLNHATPNPTSGRYLHCRWEVQPPAYCPIKHFLLLLYFSQFLVETGIVLISLIVSNHFNLKTWFQSS